jgi:hypothetical protein
VTNGLPCAVPFGIVSIVAVRNLGFKLVRGQTEHLDGKAVIVRVALLKRKISRQELLSTQLVLLLLLLLLLLLVIIVEARYFDIGGLHLVDFDIGAGEGAVPEGVGGGAVVIFVKGVTEEIRRFHTGCVLGHFQFKS